VKNIALESQPLFVSASFEPYVQRDRFHVLRFFDSVPAGDLMGALSM
jgi:hypothetical protein